MLYKSIKFKRQSYTILILSLVNFLSFIFFITKTTKYYNILAYIWLAIAIINLYKFLSFLTKGYIEITNESIKINTGGLNGFKTFYFSEIKIIEKPNYYIISHKEEKIKIHNFNIREKDFQLYLNEMNYLKKITNNKSTQPSSY